MLKKVLTFLDGWKLLVGVAVVFVVKVYDNFHETHFGDMAGSLLAVFGWDSDGSGFAAEAAGPAIVLIGVAGKLWKAQKQIRAGSGVAGALSTEGYVVAHEVALNAGKPEAVKVEEKAQTAVMVAEAGK